VSFENRDEPTAAPGNAAVGAAEKYSLEVSRLPQRVSAEEADVAVLVAHLPEDVALWVEGVLTRAKGQTRYFESPPLSPGKNFRYAVKAVWREDGRWVSQTREVVVRAGEVHRVYLRASASDRFRRGGEPAPVLKSSPCCFGSFASHRPQSQVLPE
jgi:uncharacterized protein (TIGR03000 family)